jgi:hypothetical protein
MIWFTTGGSALAGAARVSPTVVNIKAVQVVLEIKA